MKTEEELKAHLEDKIENLLNLELDFNLDSEEMTSKLDDDVHNALKLGELELSEELEIFNLKNAFKDLMIVEMKKNCNEKEKNFKIYFFMTYVLYFIELVY